MSFGHLQPLFPGESGVDQLVEIIKDDVAGCLEYNVDLVEELDRKQNASVALPMDTFKCHLIREPIGVVGLITPWNYPLLMATWKVAPALAAGCAAILKPSELASLTCLELGEICRELTPMLTRLHSLEAVPHKVMIAAAQNVKSVTLELGGKSPIVVFDDVDIDKVVEWMLFGCFWTNGQICSATSRLLVHESISEEFLEKLVKWAKTIKICDPLEEGCRLGPKVSAGQYEKVLKFVSTAKSEGATILCVGECPQPSLVMLLSELANDTHYGLGAAVISKDLERCERVSKGFEAGIVWINCSQPCFSQAPWGGKKHSGFGRVKKGRIYGFGSVSDPTSFLEGTSSIITSQEVVYEQDVCSLAKYDGKLKIRGMRTEDDWMDMK
ncbi:unnamed protein product [Lactuca virosa]|uniref:Aldehyde dehydrogenase domain-containing protein n=1 Tax=Lactuca virosa TaxID=75947 RepID=A0AAU9MWX3_9ASTR|nr:unnamed protein product [Lactuca virosa]